MTTNRKIKLSVVGLAAVVMMIIIFQNIQEVRTQILFVKVEMPLALLLFLTLAVGYALGAALGFRLIYKTFEGSAPVARDK